MGTLHDWLAGTSETLLLTDGIVGVVFGLAPLALGLAGLHQGLRRRPRRVFLIVLGALVALLGTLLSLAILSEILEGGSQADPLPLNLVFLIFLGLVPLGLGVVVLVRGIAGGRRAPGAAASTSSGARASARAAAAPTAPQRRA